MARRNVLPTTLLTALLCLLLSACGDEPVLSPAQPLAANENIIGQLHGAQPGPHKVTRVTDLALGANGSRRELLFNLYFPSSGENYPLLLFSHGNWSDKDSYDQVIEHWVSHGYSVIAPNHLDCCSAVQGIFNSLRYGQMGLIDGRVADLQRLLTELPGIEELHTAFTGKADPSRLAITGHSFGAFTAQQFGGAAALDPDSGEYTSHRDANVKAIVALSPPGPMFDTITADSWLQLSAPTLVSTGTWDVQPRFWPDWRMHLISWETALPGDKYALVTEGADHYLGNLICRPQRAEAPQEDALRMVQIATTAFLDAYLKSDLAATAFIASDKLGQDTQGFSRLSKR
jgi:predicted dienelactone hydrolase